MANVDPTLFPKDTTMSLESNHLQNEVVIFTTPESRIFVPNGGPFFAESLVIKDDKGALLKPITDYQLLYLNERASSESNKDVVTAINILKDTIDKVILDYRVIGGEYGNTVYGIRQELLNAGPIRNNVDWNINVYNKPVTFPAAPHLQSAITFTDWDKLWVQLEGIRTAIIAGDLPSWESVYRYFDRRLTTMNEIINSTVASINDNNYTRQQIDDRFVDTNELSSWGDANFFNKGYINNNYYTKSEIDGKLAGFSSSFSASVNSGLADILAQSKAYTDAKFAQIPPAVTVDLSNYYSKTEVYNKTEIDAKFVDYQNQLTELKSSIPLPVDLSTINSTLSDFTARIIALEETVAALKAGSTNTTPTGPGSGRWLGTIIWETNYTTNEVSDGSADSMKTVTNYRLYGLVSSVSGEITFTNTPYISSDIIYNRRFSSTGKIYSTITDIQNAILPVLEIPKPSNFPDATITVTGAGTPYTVGPATELTYSAGGQTITHPDNPNALRVTFDPYAKPYGMRLSINFFE